MFEYAHHKKFIVQLLLVVALSVLVSCKREIPQAFFSSYQCVYIAGDTIRLKNESVHSNDFTWSVTSRHGAVSYGVPVTTDLRFGTSKQDTLTDYTIELDAYNEDHTLKSRMVSVVRCYPVNYFKIYTSKQLGDAYVRENANSKSIVANVNEIYSQTNTTIYTELVVFIPKTEMLDNEKVFTVVSDTSAVSDTQAFLVYRTVRTENSVITSYVYTSVAGNLRVEKDCRNNPHLIFQDVTFLDHDLNENRSCSGIINLKK